MKSKIIFTLLLIISLVFMTSCSLFESKQTKMQKDVERYIEVSCSMDFMELTKISLELDTKYKGEDAVQFYNMMWTEVFKRREEGKDIGLLEIYVIYIEGIQKLVNIRTQPTEEELARQKYNEMFSPDYKGVECNDPYCCGD